ncbi:MAG: IS1595 family transposase [Bacillota bacterium]|nr:IS1595 family transposase [Bacillota bacterium]
MPVEENCLQKENESFEAFNGLKPSQVKYLKDILFSRKTEITEEEHPHCPDCSSSGVIKFGKNRLGKQRYSCKKCLRTFVLPTKSPLSCSKKPADKWLLYLECMAKGMSIRKTAAIVGIQPNTSFYWRHKILNALKEALSNDLSGIVEIDEALIPESFKGNHSKDKNFYMGRPPRKRGPRLSERPSMRRVRVLCCLDRDDSIFSQVTGGERPGIQELMNFLKDKIKTGSTICTNNNAAYKTIANRLNLKLYKLTSSNQIIEGIYHNQKAKFFGRQLQSFLVDFNGVATKYLNNYITWLKWNCLEKVKESGFKLMDIFRMLIFSSVSLRVWDLKSVHSIPEREAYMTEVCP